jgi:serine/threonine protein kinase
VNILITDERRACLADFGLATVSASQVLKFSSFTTARLGGTLRWTAPELLDGTTDDNNTKSDIYAFACICYEVPYHFPVPSRLPNSAPSFFLAIFHSMRSTLIVQSR